MKAGPPQRRAVRGICEVNVNSGISQEEFDGLEFPAEAAEEER